MEDKEIFAACAELRHRLHRIPEIAGEEFATSALIRETLAGIPGVEVLPPFLATDTVVLIRGGKGEGKRVLLRADIDALPGQETTGCGFASQHPGMMHACGHDVHMSVLLGAIMRLAARRSEFSGTLRCVFQPGEENKAMARDLIAAGALGEKLPDVCAALHVMPGRPAGELSLRDGAMMASCNHFKVKIRGQGGHGSLPSGSRSPLLAAAAMVMELQTVVPNRVDPRRSGVLSICHLSSGAIDNIIPETAEFSGTMRSLDNETAVTLEKALHEICEGVASIHRVKCEVDSRQSYLATCNAPGPAALFRRAVRAEGLPLYELPDPEMSSEDFSFYLAKIPGVFFRLGAGEEAPSLHNPGFLPPDSVISSGIRAMTAFALEALKA